MTRPGADELCFLDITASHETRGTLLDVVRRTAEVCFMPLTVGGGVRTPGRYPRLAAGGRRQGLDQHRGGERGRNSSAKRRKNSAANALSPRSTPRKPPSGRFEIFTHGGRNATGIDAVDYAKKLVALGAGEILLTSMDRDGTKKGYDLPLTRAIADAVTVPVIASGGVGNAGRSGGRCHRRPCQRRAGRLDLPFRRSQHRAGQSRAWRQPACLSGMSDCSFRRMDDPRPASIHSLSRRAALRGRSRSRRGRARIHPQDAPDEAFRAILADCLAQMTANAGVLRAGRSAKACISCGWPAPAGSGARRIRRSLCAGLAGRTARPGQGSSARLCPARDLDVFLDELWPVPPRLCRRGRAEMFAALRPEPKSARDAAWKRSAIASPEGFRRFAGRCRGAGPVAFAHGAGQRLEAVAARMLERQARRAKSAAAKPAAMRSAICIACASRSRSCAILPGVRAALQNRKVKPYLADVKRLQG